MKKSLPALLLPAVLLLAACSHSHCEQDLPYEHAQVFPSLRAPAGLSVPSPDPNLEIPQVKSGPVAAVKDPDTRTGMRCLDSPPRLPSVGS